MHLVKSIQPIILSILNLNTGQDTAVTTPLPMWEPMTGNVDRVIQRVIQDGTITTYEQEVIYREQPAAAPMPPAIREVCKGKNRIVNCDGEPARPELIAKYYADQFQVVDLAPEVPRQPWER